MRKALLLVFLGLGVLAGCGGGENGQPGTPVNPCADMGEGFASCDGTCVNLDRHKDNCGQCGVQCDGVCVEGKCEFACPDGTTECDGTCVDLASDADHCGACGASCGDNEICEKRSCVCGEGFSLCDGACVDLHFEDAHCGRCGNACDEDRHCVDASCACVPGTHDCGGVCIPEDAKNCGGCGIACGEFEVCMEGECVLSCPDGSLACDETCIDPMTDFDHCGDCETSCFEGQSCVEGECLCDGGLAACGGACVNTSNSIEHCGECGNTCIEDQICLSGSCVCINHTTFCSDECIDTSRSLEHCGECDNQCVQRANAEPPTCRGGECEVICVDGYGNCDVDPENGCETFLAVSVQHCGECGLDCSAYPNVTNAACADGTCAYECLEGYTSCTEAPGCETSLLDPKTCGSCTNDCTLLANVQAAICQEGDEGYTCGIGLCDSEWLDCDLDPLTGCESHIESASSCGSCGTTCDFACDVGGCATPVAVFVGMKHNACTVMNNGNLWCWGANSDGRLDGGNDHKRQPIHIPLPEPVAQVSGHEHFCALLTDGTVACWGKNNAGQVGDGTNVTPRPVPAVVPLLEDVVSVGTGDLHTCALNSQGEVYCWGDNLHGQLGVAPAQAQFSHSPKLIEGLPPVEKLVVGWANACGILADKTVRCWGRNNMGELGNGVLSPTELPMDPGLTNVVDLAMGNAHTCAVLADGTVDCWGGNDRGQLGFESTPPLLWEVVPREVQGVGDAKEVYAGHSHTCALTQAGELICWGSNLAGEIGDGSVEPTAPTAPTPVAQGVSHARAGWHLTCGYMGGGQVECWGQNNVGQVGANSLLPNHPSPTEIVFP